MASKQLNLSIRIPEYKLNSSNYPTFSHSLLGIITVTGGFMEPHGHSEKPPLKAIFFGGELKTLPASERNISIDYVVGDSKVNAWYGGTVTKAGW